MYKKTVIALVGYIKKVIPTLEVFDVNFEFKDPANYASLYILNITPTSPHENNISQSRKDDNTKTFTYKETNYINIRIDFRGDNANENIALFKSSFLKEELTEFLKEAGFDFLELGTMNPINSLRGSKSKFGMTTTLKLISSTFVIDESQIIKDIKLTVSKK